MILVLLVKLMSCQSSMQIPQYATGTLKYGQLNPASFTSPLLRTVSTTFSSTFSVKPQIYLSVQWMENENGYQCQSLKITSLTLTSITVQISHCANTGVYQFYYQYLAVDDPYVYVLNQTINPSTSQTSQIFQFTQSWTQVPSYAIAILSFQFQGNQAIYSASIQLIQISVSNVTVLFTESTTNELFAIQYNLISAPSQFLNSATQAYDWSQPYLTIGSNFGFSLLTITPMAIASSLSQINNIQVSNINGEFNNQLMNLINQTQVKLVYLSNLFDNGALNKQLFQLYYQNYQQLNFLIQILSAQIYYYTTQNISTSNLTLQLESSIKLLQNMSVPNQPPNIVSSKYLNMLSAVQSQKLINSQTGGLLEAETEIGNTRLLQITDQAQIYQYSNRIYGLNPYQQDESFPKNSTNYSCVETSLINAQTQISQPILQNATIKINLNSKINSTIQCISKLDGTWQANICSTKTRNNSVSCNCQQLSPVSLMNALDLIESEVGKSFTSDAINALSTFAFWETIVFQRENIQSNAVAPKREVDEIFKANHYKIINTEKHTVETTKIKYNTEGQKNKIYPIFDDLPDLHDKPVASNVNTASLSVEPITKSITIQKTISKTRAYIIFIQQFHIVLSIAYKYDKNLSRPVRCSILYISTLGMLATIFMLGQQNNISVSIALALILAPLSKIFSLVFEKLLSSTNRLLKCFGVVLIFSVSGLWSYILLSQIALLGSAFQVNQLTINFLAAWFFDNLIYAQIQLLVQFTVQTYIITIPLLKSLMDKLLDEQSTNFIEELRQQL